MPLYVDDVARQGPAASGTPIPTFMPGQVAYFLTRAINTPTKYPGPIGGPSGWQQALTAYDTHLVTLEITGPNSFYMLADRAGVIDDYGNNYTIDPTPPGAPNTGLYSIGYRGMAWKIPPFMTAGTYVVRFYSYKSTTPNGSNPPQYFGPTGQPIAQGSLVVSGTTPPPSQGLQYVSPGPTAGSPVFGLQWPTGAFPGASSTVPNLRVIVRNTATKRYYALSPGYTFDPSYSDFFPSWDADASYPNTGGKTIRYNSTALFGGLNAPYVGVTASTLTPPAVPAGNYEVYLDDKYAQSGALTTYLTAPIVNGVITPIYLP